MDKSQNDIKASNIDQKCTKNQQSSQAALQEQWIEYDE